MTLNERYTQLVHDYCKEFYSQMYPDGEERYDPDYWVGEEVGEILLVDREYLYLHFNEIRLVVDNQIPWEVLWKWFDEQVERGAEEKRWVNLKNYWKLVRSEDDLEEAHENVIKLMDK